MTAFTYEDFEPRLRRKYEIFEERIRIGLHRANRALKKRGLPKFTETTRDLRPIRGCSAYCFGSSAEHYDNPDDKDTRCFFISAEASTGVWEAWGFENGEHWSATGRIWFWEAEKEWKRKQEARP